MPKRKFVPRAHRSQQEKNENESSSDSDKLEAKSKRFKAKSPLDILKNEGSSVYNADESLPVSDVESDEMYSPELAQLPSDNDYSEESTQNGIPEDLQMDKKLIFKPPVQNDQEDEMPAAIGGNYDGFESFMRSFHFLSDEEDSKKVDDHQNAAIKKFKRNFPLENMEYVEETNEMEDSAEEILEKAEEILEKAEEILNVRAFPLYLAGNEVLFIEYPSSLQICGHLQVTLISGKVSIYGHTLTVNKSVTVFSQRQTGILSLTSHLFEKEEPIMHNIRRHVGEKLLTLNLKSLKKHIKKKCGPSTSVVILRELPLPSPLQFLQLYAPEALSFKTEDKKDQTMYSFNRNEKHALDFSTEYHALFTRLERHLCKINRGKPAGSIKPCVYSESSFSDSDEDTNDAMVGDDKSSTDELTGSRILIYGPKKSGKSTLLRYLINKFLNDYHEVFYLDTDPGQTEFTPPGSVSLTKVTKPLLGPPFTHQLRPLQMIFTGTITAETSPPMHIRSIKSLLNYFNSNYPKSILLVNTMGWITGIGDIMLQVIKKNVNPTVEIELEKDLNPLNISTEGKLLKLKIGFDRDSSSSTNKGEFRPADLRDWNLLAYLGKCQQYFKLPTFLNAMRPVCVRWDDIAVYNFNRRLPYTRFYEALNCSIVALCNVEECYMLMSTNSDYPNTLDDEPNNDCLGYGLVRAVDEKKHLLYVVTPLDLSTLKRVNAIISGNVLVPRSVIFDQPILDTELPYTDESKKGRTEARKAIRRRSRINTSNIRNN